MSPNPTLLDIILHELAAIQVDCTLTGYSDYAHGAMELARAVIRRHGGHIAYNDRGRVYELNGQSVTIDHMGRILDT